MKTRDELAYCGSDCEQCHIYKAAVLGEPLSPETFQRWQADFKKFLNIDLVDPKQLNCRGCRNNTLDTFYGFTLCPIRKCCLTRGLSSCGLCPELDSFKQHDNPEGKANLARLDSEK